MLLIAANQIISFPFPVWDRKLKEECLMTMGSFFFPPYAFIQEGPFFKLVSHRPLVLQLAWPRPNITLCNPACSRERTCKSRVLSFMLFKLNYPQKKQWSLRGNTEKNPNLGQILKFSVFSRVGKILPNAFPFVNYACWSPLFLPCPRMQFKEHVLVSINRHPLPLALIVHS